MCTYSLFMPQVHFTANLQRHISALPASVEGATVRAALEHVFASNPLLRGYILDDQGALRKHMNVFVNGELIEDRDGLSDAVSSEANIWVMQALSGGLDQVAP